MNKGGWNNKKRKSYIYAGKVVKAVNKPEAARKLGLTTYAEIDKVRRVKV